MDLRSSSPSIQEASTPTSPRRSKTGCLTCRARKVRCDLRAQSSNSRSSPSCGRCVRLGLQCVRSDNGLLPREAREALSRTADARPNLTQAGLSRIRTPSSCVSCRSRRQKCTGDRPACARCAKARRECVYDSGERRSTGAVEGAVERRESGRVSSERTNAGDGSHGGNSAGDDDTSNESSTIRNIRPSRDEVRAISPAAEEPLPAQGADINSTRSELQDMPLVHALAKTFFREIAPLRCFGFIHEPSFMQRLAAIARCATPDPLLLVVCALATTTASHAVLRELGREWSRTAREIVFSRISRIDVHTLMTIVLLHEHSSRSEELGLCFLLSSMACRFCQALQLNVEYDLDIVCESSKLSATEKETRRRLMWACYCMDVETACGVDQLRLLHEEDIRVQLPAHEESFFYRVAEPTGFLSPVGVPWTSTPDGDVARRGHRAFHVQLTVCRDRILRYLKRDHREDCPSNPGSEFNQLAADLDAWQASLPADLRLSPEVVYVRRNQGMLGALFSLHIGYHQCCSDLYRCMVPDLQMPPSCFAGMNASPGNFLEHGRARWFEHACQLSEVFRTALENPHDSMSDPETGIGAYTAARGKLYYLQNIMTGEEYNANATKVNDLIAIDLKYLQALKALHPSVNRTLEAANEMIRTLDPRRGGEIPAEDAAADGQTAAAGSEGDAGLPMQSPPSQVSADYLLHPLAVFRVARRGIAEKHVPEKLYRPSLQGFSPGADVALFDHSWLLGARDMNDSWMAFMSDAGTEAAAAVQLPWDTTNGLSMM